MKAEHPCITKARQVIAQHVKDEEAVKLLMNMVATEVLASSMDSDLRKSWVDYAIESLDQQTESN